MSAYKINMHLNSPTRDYVGNIFVFIKAMKIKIIKIQSSTTKPKQMKFKDQKKTVNEEKKYLLCKL